MQVPLLTSRRWLALGCLCAVGCGAAGGTDGGGAGLPDRGIVPYEKLAPVPDEDVDFLVPAGGNPAALVVDGAVELLYDDPEGIWHASVQADGAVVDARLVRAGASGAAVARWGDGFAIAWVEADAVVVARGTAVDDLDAEPLATLPGASSPSVVVQGEALLIYVTRDLAVDVHSLTADGAVSAAVRVLDSDADCIDEAEDPCWDRMGVDDAEVRVARTALGRTVFRMMYTGVGTSFNRGVGFAASFDGVAFNRYPFNPIFSESGRESQPSNVKLGNTYWLFFRDRVGNAEGLGYATIEVDSPSDQF